MTSSLFCLLALAPTCRLSLHEKGKKRAKCGNCLITRRTAVQHLVAVVQASPVPETCVLNVGSTDYGQLDFISVAAKGKRLEELL